MNKQKWKILILSSLGGGLEYYDFIIYAIFAPYIGKAFFPSNNPLISLIETFMVFGLGYLARPIGGFIFSHLGDKIGRKKIFSYTILIMALSSILIAFVPGFHQAVHVFLIFIIALCIVQFLLKFINIISLKVQLFSTTVLIVTASSIVAFVPSKTEIGITATIIFCILRIIQGFSIGGEIPCSITFICEHLKENRGFACGTLYFFINNGIVAATLIQWFLFSILPATSAEYFGWRIAFFMGGLLAVISYYIRMYLEETPDFNASVNKIKKIPLIALLKEHYFGLTAGFLIASFGATIVAVPYLYLYSYMDSILKYPALITNSLTFAGTLIYSFTTLLGGYFTDRFGAKNITIIGIIAIIFFPIPFFHILAQSAGYFTLIVLFCFMALFAGLPTASFPVMLAQLFPTEIRYSGIATSYNLAFAVFCGLVPLACSSLIHLTSNIMWPAYILILSAVIGLRGIVIINCNKKLKKGYLY